MSESIGGDQPDHISQAQLLGAVADPLRLQILASVRRPRPVQEICASLGGLSQPRVSHHLAVLRERGLVTAERRGRQRLYVWAEPTDGPRRELLRMLSRWLESTPGSIGGRAAGEAAPPPPSPGPHSGELEDFLL